MDEAKFIEDFMTFFNNCNEYDITLVFDLFYDAELVQKSKIEELFNIYFPTKNIENDEQLLYDKLYSIVETSIINNCESEADTDKED